MRNHRERTGRTLPALLAGLGLVCAPLGAARAQDIGDDLFLIQTAVAPNVVILMDNSNAMKHIEWHPAFDPEAGSYGCSDFTNGTVYTYTQADAAAGGGPGNIKRAIETHCGNTRSIWAPENGDTLWDGRYLNWYFSDDADPYISEIENSVASLQACASSGASQFANRYRRNRHQASKQVLLDLLCLAEPKNVRFALAEFRANADVGGVDPNGGYISSDLGRSNPNHAVELESKIKNSLTVAEAPLAETLFQIYSYWMPRDTADIPVGADGLTKFPLYVYKKTGVVEGNVTQYLEDTLLFECEKAFVVIISTGLPTRDDFDPDPASTSAGFSDFVNLIGDYHDDGNDGVADVEVPGDADETSWYLDDIAKYMAENDFRPDLAGDQTIDTYTVALAANPTTSDFLRKTAEVGNGVYYEAKDGDQLAIALIQVLNAIIEKSASFTSAAVSSARTIDGAAFYQSYLFPQQSSAAWEGHVRAWHIESNGDIVDSNGNCALIDPDSGACPGPSCECNSGPFNPNAVYFWDAYEEIPAPASRTLYASKLVSGTPTRVAFDSALTAADLTISAFTAAPDPAPNDALYPTAGSTALVAEGLADEAVAFARGCFFGTGVTDGSLVATPLACQARPNRLGDIFHSNPVVVRQPSTFLLEPSYEAFKLAYASRKRVIYAGTNGGFLEAIDAGTWLPSATPLPKYDAGTGVELFGFMPWAARQKIKNYPIDDPSVRNHYVDGAAQVADVWIHPSATATTKNANGSEWRTMLVTGLRKGGRQVLALDITNPDGIVGPGGVTLEYPGFQASGPAHGWEFPPENDPDGDLAHMGETWSQPIITRVQVSVNADGVAHERWVAIFAGGYDANGDPNPSAVSGLVSTYDSAATEGRAIFMVEMKTGQVLARKIFDSGASDAQTAMVYAMPSTPAVFDLDADGFADVVYVGDLGGQMFKWVINPLGGDPINGSATGDDVNQPNWPFVLFFEAPVTKISGKDYFQNFYTAPAGALLHGDVWLAWGAAERRSLGFEGITGNDGENNRLYVVGDADPYELVGLGTLDESALVDATAYPGGVFNTNGFYIRGADGEKFVTNTVIFTNLVITNSFTPTSDPNPCLGGGSAQAYVFDLLTGEGFFSDVNGDPVRTVNLGVGLPTDPKISLNVGGTGGGGGGGPGPCGTGQGNRVYIETSGGGLESFGTCDVPTGGQLLYWREVQ